LIGVKVWICRGEVYGKRDLMLHFKAPKKKGGGKPGGNNRRRK
jgi:small subunit ribosomal protein S3